MDIAELLEAVCGHLSRHRVECEVKSGGKVSKQAILRGESKLRLRLPLELSEFYLAVGDGVSLRWQADPDDLNKPFANFQVPRLTSLVRQYTAWR